MKRSNIFKLGLLISVIPFILGLIFYKRMPDIMAVHFDFRNNANGFAGRSMALFGIPAILTAVYVIAYYTTKLDPKRYNQNEKLMSLIILFIPVLNVIVSVLEIYINLGYKIDLSNIMTVLLGLLFIVIGNYLPKVKRNYTLGIKLPWTMDNDYIWDKTHRFGGYVYIIGGILLIILSLLFKSDYLFVLIIAAVIILPIIYSLIIYKKIYKN